MLHAMGDPAFPRALTASALLALIGNPAAAQRPSSEQQHRVIEAAREAAVHYSSTLPDFLCTENVERSDTTGPKIMKVDRLVIQLSYFGQKEKQKLVAMNGSPTQQPLESLEGLITSGEFGSLLLGIFDASSAAQFEWKASSNLHQHPAAVYSFKIARKRSHYMVGYRAGNGKLVWAGAGYHGEVVLDDETSRVLRLAAAADDIPRNSGILQSSVEVDYDFVEVAARKYLLPAHSESRMERSYRKIANTVNFVDYRKFEASSTIDFKPEDQ